MSNDIVTNQISKDVLNPSTAQNTKVTQGQDRQEDTVQEGKELPPETEPVEVSREDLQKAVAQINDYVQDTQRDLFFSIDDDSGRNVVRVVNAITEEEVRQIPNEEVLKISRNIQEQLDDGFGLSFETSA